MTHYLTFFISCGKGIEPFLEQELRELADDHRAAEFAAITPDKGGVRLQGNLAAGYVSCLYLRSASRVLLQLSTFQCAGAEDLYRAIGKVNWTEHLAVDNTIAVDFNESRSSFRNTHFGALKTKDAIVDQFMERTNRRPDVDTARPDVRINVHVHENQGTVSLDLSGSSLHERGYRQEFTRAPLKENLAAALLLAAGFPAAFRAGGSMVDPACGSGTLCIEALRMACDIAPGLERGFGFQKWKKHDKRLWGQILDDAMTRADAGIASARQRTSQFPFLGFDTDASAIRIARDTAARLGLADLVQFQERDLSEAKSGASSGIVICNPPYGERLGSEETLRPLYRRIGDLYKQQFRGWKGFVFTGSTALSKEVGLKASRKFILFNGPIECRLLAYELY